MLGFLRCVIWILSTVQRILRCNNSKARAPPPAKTDPVEQTPGKVLESFGKILQNHLKEVNKLDEVADKAIETYATGGPIELHQVMIAEERADLAMELTMQFRNKVLQAYQEISRMGM